MIARLRGKILELQPPFLLLEVNGVGYEVEAPLSTIFNLPPVGEEVTLHISMIVRDDAHLLFGFSSPTEKKMFQTLIKITGVGAKMVLAILSGMSVEEFVSAIRNKDVNQLVRLPGVGQKTAQRLIVEMQDRLKEINLDVTLPGKSVSANDLAEQATQALVALGYKAADARNKILAIQLDNKSLEEIITQALKGS